MTSRLVWLVWLVVLAGCGRGAKSPEPTAGSSTPGPSRAGSAVAVDAGSDAVATDPAPPAASGAAIVPNSCSELPFEETTPVAEASGAAWLDIDGKLALVVISDSGNDGEYGIIDPTTGKTLETGKLPLGGAGADLEGVAARDGLLWAITSPGWIRSWKRVGKQFQLVAGPYALGPIDLTGKVGAVGDKPPAGAGMVCDAKSTNCGRNYEGLCLAPTKPSNRCVGFAAAKADGHLYCLVEQDGKLAVERDGAIAIARPGSVADCAFSESGVLYAGSNLFDLGKVYSITGWQDPKTAKVQSIGALGVGFPETLAVRGDVLYRMSDLGDARQPSAMKKYQCQTGP